MSSTRIIPTYSILRYRVDVLSGYHQVAMLHQYNLIRNEINDWR